MPLKKENMFSTRSHRIEQIDWQFAASQFAVRSVCKFHVLTVLFLIRQAFMNL